MRCVEVQSTGDQELDGAALLLAAIRQLPPEARLRVMGYVYRRTEEEERAAIHNTKQPNQ